MPAISPSDEPSLPKLRRFRFDAQDPKVAREVNSDAEASVPVSEHADALDVAAGEPETQNLTSDRVEAPGMASGDDLRASEGMLAALNGSLTATPSTDSPTARPTGPSAEPATRPTDRSGFSSGSQQRPLARAGGPGPTSPSGASGMPLRTGPTTLPAPLVDPDGTKGRSGWILAVVGIVIALIIGLIAWIVLVPTDEPAESREQTRGANSAVSDWADGICGELDVFQTASLPLRAEVAKANVSGSDSADVSDLQRQSSELLSTLAADLQTIEMPSDSEEASTAHTTIISAVNAAATSAKVSGGSAVGTPEDATAAILDALDRPVAVFQQTLDDLSASDRAGVGAVPSCQALI